MRGAHARSPLYDGPHFARALHIVAPVEANVPDESLCVRLRRGRERRQIPLSSISANTKISATLFEALERGDLSAVAVRDFPQVVHPRVCHRNRARPGRTAREFLEEFPDPLDPTPPVVPPQARRRPSANGRPASAVPFSAQVFSAVARKWTAPVEARTPDAATAPKPAASQAVRVKVADTPTPFVRGALLAACGSVSPPSRATPASSSPSALLHVRGVRQVLAAARRRRCSAITSAASCLLGNTPGVCLLAPDDRSTPRLQSAVR